MKPYLRDLQADAIELLNEGKYWVVAGVETSIFWPRIAQVVPYEGKDFILRPSTEQFIPTIAFNSSKYGLNVDAARDAILTFASALVWSGKSRLEIVGWTGGGRPIQMGRGRTQTVTDYLDPSLLESMKTDDEQTILAFYREGISSRNPFYSFLNFYKVVAYAHKDGKVRGEWIKLALTKVARGPALDRYEQLRAEHGDQVDKYLMTEGRHAIAHAEKDSFVNPDKLGDRNRIYADLSIRINLATHSHLKPAT